MDQYLNKFPTSMFNSNAVNNYALITRDAIGDITYKGKLNLLVYGSDTTTATGFSNVYETARNRAATDYVPFIYEELKANEKWNDGTLTIPELNSIISSKSGSLQTSINSFVGMFSDTGQLSTKYKNWVNDNDEHGATKYFDMLVVLNKMCGGVYDSYLSEYIQTKNVNNSDSFIVVDIYSMISMRNATQTVMYWYTYPSYMATETGRDTSVFGQTEGVHSGETYGSNPTAYKAKDKAKDNSLFTTSAHMYFKYNREFAWYGTWNARYSLMPGDMDGKQTGGSGYTFFTDAVRKDVVPLGVIYLEALPDNKQVKKGDAVQADIEISLKQSSIAIEDFKSKFKEQLAKGKKPTLTLTLAFQGMEGTGTSPKPYDISTTAGATLTGTQIVIPNLTIEDFNLYMNGSKTIKLVDSGITVTANTKNKYSVSATLVWAGEDPVVFSSVGKDKASDGTPTAFDYANWLITPEAEPDSAYYYSEMEEPYVEIKEGSPSNETYEAMAGVPTTEDLYVGFGATEFMTNMDVQRKESSGTRGYRLIHTISQCIEVDAICTISCSTHTTATHMIKAAVPAVTGTDAEGNSILEHLLIQILKD